MELWTVLIVAGFLHRSPGAVRNLVMRGKIAYRKVKGRLCFLPDEIRAWVNDSPGKTLEEIRAEEGE